MATPTTIDRRSLTRTHRTGSSSSNNDDNTDPMPSTNLVVNNKENLLGFASGLVAGIVGVITGYPLDTLKVKMQVYGNTSSVSLLGDPANPQNHRPLTVLRQLFRGVVPPLATTGLVQTLNFGIYDNTLRYLRTRRLTEEGVEGRRLQEETEQEGYTNPLIDYFVGGAVGGAAISFITCPASLIKIQMQTATSNSTNYISILRSMRQKGLIAGYYRAYLPDVLNQSFGRGVYMYTYEGLKRLIHTHTHTQEEQPAESNGKFDVSLIRQPQPLYERILAGALAGIAGWLVIYPLDVVKSRMQADALAPGQNKYSSMTDCFRQSYRSGGWRSLYSGLGFTLIRAVPVASVILPTFDGTYYLLSKYIDAEGGEDGR